MLQSFYFSSCRFSLFKDAVSSIPIHPMTNLCPPIGLYQMACDEGNFLTIMMLAQAFQHRGDGNEVGVREGNSNRHHDVYNEHRTIL